MCQIERIDRLMKIVEADNPHVLASGLLTIDVIKFACQSMWHLKDWISTTVSLARKTKKN